MNRSGSKYRIFVAAWTISALMLCIGSLIHFHQWKIYHKPLVSDVVVTKREQENIVKDLSADNHVVFHADAEFCDNYSLPLFSAIRTAVTSPDRDLTLIHCLANSGLRAPPLA